ARRGARTWRRCCGPISAPRSCPTTTTASTRSRRTRPAVAWQPGSARSGRRGDDQAAHGSRAVGRDSAALHGAVVGDPPRGGREHSFGPLNGAGDRAPDETRRGGSRGPKNRRSYRGAYRRSYRGPPEGPPTILNEFGGAGHEVRTRDLRLGKSSIKSASWRSVTRRVSHYGSRVGRESRATQCDEQCSGTGW